MDVERLRIPDVFILRPKRFGDERGWFSETYSRRTAAACGLDTEFVQDNQSYSKVPLTLRGLHFQEPPFAQAKLVRCLRGAIFDVAVDLRTGSDSYGQHVSAVLTRENRAQIFVPRGFAHGFLTLEPDTEIFYKVDAFYAPDYDRGIIWNDSELGIPWPLDGAEPVLSEKDRNLPRLVNMRFGAESET